MFIKQVSSRWAKGIIENNIISMTVPLIQRLKPILIQYLLIVIIKINNYQYNYMGIFPIVIYLIRFLRILFNLLAASVIHNSYDYYK